MSARSRTKEVISTEEIVEETEKEILEEE